MAFELPTLDDITRAGETVYRTLVPTPAHAWPLLARRTGATVLVKHENHTPIGAFKVRGGLVHMAALKEARPDATGVITATRGNHGQSVAFAARAHGLAATVVVPEGNSVEKNAAMRALGATLVVHGHDFQAAYEFMTDEAAARGLVMVDSYAPTLVCGVATYALELFTAAPDLDALFVPIGLGSGITGCIAAREALGRTTEIYGVVAEAAPAYALSFEAGGPVATNTADTIADGMACRTPAPDAVAVINRHAAGIVRVSEAQIAAAMRHYYTDTHNLAEGAGAAPLAALLKERGRWQGRKVGLVLSGGNVDAAMFAGILAEEAAE